MFCVCGSDRLWTYEARLIKSDREIVRKYLNKCKMPYFKSTATDMLTKISVTSIQRMLFLKQQTTYVV